MCSSYPLFCGAGVYLFFIFFGLGLLLLQLVIGAATLWVTGTVPKIFLVAKAHSVSPLTVFCRLFERRRHRSKHIACPRPDASCGQAHSCLLALIRLLAVEANADSFVCTVRPSPGLNM
jgi:hypothetical protein